MGFGLPRLSRLFVVLFVFSTTGFANAGSWNQVDSQTIAFEGRIELGEFDRFSAVFDPSKTKVLFVNSRGGVIEEGLKIGLALAAQPIKIVVKGQCLSSCANYLFVGAGRREIHGIVGFHGNATACFTGKNEIPYDKSLREVALKINPNATEEQIANSIRDSHAQTGLDVRDEAVLNQERGVSQQLFDISCLPDKGAGDGKEYEFLLPTRQTFEKYGLHGVTGEQDRDLANGLGYPVLIK